MKKLTVAVVITIVVFYGLGCCGAVDKAKDIAEEVEKSADTAARLVEEMDALRDDNGNFEITQARIDMFISEFPIFKDVMKAKADEVEENKGDFQKGLKSLAEFVNIDKDLRKEGMKNPPEFYLTMTEVSAGLFYVSFEGAREKADAEMQKQIAIMKQQLENPDIPKEQKEIFRTTIAEMEEPDTIKAEIPEVLTEKELALIRKNFDKLVEAFGMQIELKEEAGEQVEDTDVEKPADEPKDEAAKVEPVTPKGGKQKGERVK